MEPRARAGRHKSGLNFGDELRQFLMAYGAPTHPDLIAHQQQSDSDRYLSTVTTSTLNNTHRPTPYADSDRFPNPYPETLRVLDEILTDFVIETCHGAVRHASLAGRQKITGKDFDFVVRRDMMKMGRMQTMMRRQKQIKEDRKIVSDEKGGKMDESFMEGLAGLAGEESGTGKGRGRGRGRRRKRGEMERDGKENGDAAVSGGGVGALNGLVGEDDLDFDADGDDGEEEQPPVKKARSDTG